MARFSFTETKCNVPVFHPMHCIAITSRILSKLLLFVFVNKLTSMNYGSEGYMGRENMQGINGSLVEGSWHLGTSLAHLSPYKAGDLWWNVLLYWVQI